MDEREVRKLLRSLPEHSLVGTYMLDSKVLGLAADYVYGPICHILNACIMKGVYPTIWKEGTIIPIPKDGRLALTGKNSRPITILPVLSKLMERIVYSQIQEYFNFNGLNIGFQHAYRHNHDIYIYIYIYRVRFAGGDGGDYPPLWFTRPTLC